MPPALTVQRVVAFGHGEFGQAINLVGITRDERQRSRRWSRGAGRCPSELWPGARLLGSIGRPNVTSSVGTDVLRVLARNGVDRIRGHRRQDLDGGLGRRRRWLHVAHVVGRHAVEGIRVSALGHEVRICEGSPFEPRGEGAAIGRDVDRVRRDARAAWVVGAGPAHGDDGRGRGHRVVGLRCLPVAGVDCDQVLLVRVDTLGRIAYVNLIGGDRLTLVEGDVGDVADRGAGGQSGEGPN